MIAVNPLNPENVGALPAGASAVDADKLGGRAPDEYRLTASAGALRAAVSADTEITNATGIAMPLKETFQIGDYFRVDETSITVLKTCVVEVSAIAYMFTGFVAGSNHFLSVVKNGELRARAGVYFTVANPYASVAIPATTMGLSAGDIIELSISNGSTARLGGLVKAYETCSYINIQVIG